MFTPFKGDILQLVLDRLRQQALRRKITLITYGPCTTKVAAENWLHGVSPEAANIYKPAVFYSS
jgi:hypothetical protein